MKKGIPLFQTSYYETLCRQSGIYMPDKIRACIRQYAQNKDQDYNSNKNNKKNTYCSYLNKFIGQT